MSNSKINITISVNESTYNRYRKHFYRGSTVKASDFMDKIMNEAINKLELNGYKDVGIMSHEDLLKEFMKFYEPHQELFTFSDIAGSMHVTYITLKNFVERGYVSQISLRAISSWLFDDGGWHAKLSQETTYKLRK